MSRASILTADTTVSYSECGCGSAAEPAAARSTTASHQQRVRTTVLRSAGRAQRRRPHRPVRPRRQRPPRSHSPPPPWTDQPKPGPLTVVANGRRPWPLQRTYDPRSGTAARRIIRAWAPGLAWSVITMGESSDAEVTEVGSGSSELLHAILNLSRFHREHEKFYASAPRQQAVILQGHGRTLCALADRWETIAPSVRVAFSPFEGAEDLNDPAALQLDGVLFMEGEGEPAEITRIKRDVRTIGDEVVGHGSVVDQPRCRHRGTWPLPSATSPRWPACSVTDIASSPTTGKPRRSAHWRAGSCTARWSCSKGSSSRRRPCDATSSQDRVAPRLLHSASELIAHAADLLSDSAGLVHDNEPRWRRFRARVEEVVHDLDSGRRLDRLASRFGGRRARGAIVTAPPSTDRASARPLLGLRGQPGRLALAVFRLPLGLYRRGGGWLLGPTFLVFTHVGRTTGKRYETAAMVLTYDSAAARP